MVGQGEAVATACKEGDKGGFSYLQLASFGRFQPVTTGRKRPRVCKNALVNPCYDF
jgi:hypothetical protein